MDSETLTENDQGLEILNQATCHHALSSALSRDANSGFESQPDVLQQIISLVDGASQTGHILWVYGDSGIQAASLAQALVDSSSMTKRLVGGFFFQEGCTEGRHLFPAIAYQVAKNVPELRKPINDVLSRNSEILSKSISEQYDLLLVEPMGQYLTNDSTCDAVVVVAGLDACEGPDGTQTLILNCLADFIKRSKLPFHILITSRPTPEICQSFASEALNELTQRIALPNSESSILRTPSNSADVQNNATIPKRKKPRTKPPFNFPSYPRIVTLQRRNGHAESYCRSLLLCGNGFPMWKPSGDFGMPSEVLEKGLSIGDLGTIDQEGYFQYYFNIFHPPDHPLNVNFTPREFRPIAPPLQQDEVVYEEEYFKPGHIITSKGVNMARHSDDPLDVSFSSDELEGAILVLPTGASRQDLISTSRFHEYIRKNAPHWYQYINDYSGLTQVNGSLFLVTGCDKANDWAVASFPYRAGNTSRKLDLRYTWQPEHKPPWRDPGTADTDFYGRPQERINPKGLKNQCIFMRGLRISLTQQSWLRTIPYPENGRLHYSFILHTPSKFQRWLNSILVFLHLRLSEALAVDKVSAQEQHIFHPNYILGQVLMAEYPSAEVAVVDDSVWCSLVHGESCTIVELNNLVTDVFDAYHIVEKDGIVSLLPKTHRPQEKSLVTPAFAWPRRRSKKPVQWVKSIPVYKHAKLF